MLRILWLYAHDDTYNFDDALHMGYARYLATHPYITLKAYGPRIHEKYPELLLQPYHKAALLKDLHAEYSFDVVIANTKSRLFAYYSPHARRAEGCWLPSDFKRFDVPKVMLEEDFHYETYEGAEQWYADTGFDLLLNRHYQSAQRSAPLKNIWFPFSVDTNTFQPNPKTTRQPKICLAASCTPHIYPLRRMVLDQLKPHGLIEGHLTQHWTGAAYVQCLQQFMAHVACTSIYDITPAKIFEIIASGSVLFINRDGNYGMSSLFPDTAYMTYANDGSDVVAQAQRILADATMRDEMTSLGRRVIFRNHTHYHRSETLRDILRQELKVG